MFAETHRTLIIDIRRGRYHRFRINRRCEIESIAAAGSFALSFLRGEVRLPDTAFGISVTSLDIVAAHLLAIGNFLPRLAHATGKLYASKQLQHWSLTIEALYNVPVRQARTQPEGCEAGLFGRLKTEIRDELAGKGVNLHQSGFLADTWTSAYFFDREADFDRLIEFMLLVSHEQYKKRHPFAFVETGMPETPRPPSFMRAILESCLPKEV